MAVKFTNNAKTTLASGITSSATSATVTDGSVFPSLSSGEHFYCTFDDGTNNEIVKVTARSGNTLTIVRAADNTTARAFSSGNQAELRATAALLTDIQENIAAKSANQTVYNTTTASSATTYDVGTDPGVEGNAMVFLNGVLQHHDTISFSGSTLTFDTAPPNGMALEVIIDNLINLQSSNLTVDTFTAADVSGSPQTDFTLSDTPAAEQNLIVFVDGVFQAQDAYTISNEVLTMTDGVTAGLDVTVYVINPVNIGTPSDSTVTSAKLSGDITTPGAFTVSGAFTSQGIDDNADATAITISSDENVTFTSNVVIPADLTVDTSTLKVDSTNNRVGIGTASPANGKLEVKDTYTGQIGLFEQEGTGGGNHGIEVRCASTSGWAFLTKVNGTAKLGQTGDATYIGGQLGIGTTSPSASHAIDIHNDAPIINIKDTNGSGSAATGYIQWQDSGANNKAYIGLGSGSTNTLHITNYVDEANIEFLTNGETQFLVTNNNNADSEDCAVLQGTPTDGSSNVDVIRMTKMGYGASYQVTQFGQKGGGRNISLMYDPSTNTNGGFGGNGECLVANEFKLLGANAANNGFIGMMRLAGDNSLRIGGNYTVGGWLTFNTSGNATFSGSLSKGSGSFKIDHPLESKKDTHHLVHSFVEAPQADNIYRGKVDLVDGSATVNIDTVAGMTEGTFAALNREVQCFTSNESDWDAVKGSVSGNILTISCQNNSSTATISWLVVGERKDQHMYDTDWTDENGKVIVEPEKVEELEEEMSAEEQEENA